MKILAFIIPVLLAQDIPCNIVGVGDNLICNTPSIWDNLSLTFHLYYLFSAGDTYGFQDFCTNGATALSTGPTPLVNQDYYQNLVNNTVRVDYMAFGLGTSDAAIGVWDEAQFEIDYKAIVTQMMNVSSYGNLKNNFYLIVPPPYYVDDGKINQTAVNVVLPTLIPKIASDLGIDDDHIINLFEIMGGERMDKYELFCDDMSCDPQKPNYVGMYYIAAKVWKAMPHDFLSYINGQNNDEVSFLS